MTGYVHDVRRSQSLVADVALLVEECLLSRALLGNLPVELHSPVDLNKVRLLTHHDCYTQYSEKD